ncbi:MAG: hypothetical protein M3Y87_25445 [Myxococcota bacterium]|nr:hypothetical protein [Myxococcota bacterium]
MEVHREGGTLVISRGRGAVPIRLHWSLAIAMALAGRFTLGGAVGIFVVILVHELGHAALVRARGLRAIGIEMHWMGGECRYDGSGASPLDVSIVAWGGVAAQAVLLAIAWPLARILEPTGVLGDLAYALVVPNFVIMALNLLPIGPLDGARAWALLPMLGRRAGRRRLEEKHEKLRRELDALRRRRERDSDADDE